MTRSQLLVSVAAAAATVFYLSAQDTPAREPKRIKKAIELLEAGQPVYYTSGHGGYEEGKKLARRQPASSSLTAPTWTTSNSVSTKVS